MILGVQVRNRCKWTLSSERADPGPPLIYVRLFGLCPQFAGAFGLEVVGVLHEQGGALLSVFGVLSGLDEALEDVGIPGDDTLF